MASIRVLLAERNPLMRSGIACLLENVSDITIIAEARSGEQTLALAEKTDPDLLLLDSHLPDLSAIEIVREFRDQGRSTEIVVMTEKAEEAELFELLAGGVRGLVARRDEPEVLLEAIRSVAAGHELWLSPRVAAKLVLRKGKAPGASGLTGRERDVLQMLARGERNEQIAEALHLRARTVRNHLSSIYGKLGIRSRSEAVSWAWRNALVQVG